MSNPELAAIEAELAAAYERGRSTAPVRPAEPTDPGIVALGRRLCDDLVASWAGAFEDTGHRLFLCIPRSPRSSHLFTDLTMCLSHAGVPWTCASHDDPHLATRLAAFAPDALVITWSPAFASSAGREAIARYCRSHRCLRLAFPFGSEGSDPALASSLLAETDACLSVFVREDFERRFPGLEAAAHPLFELFTTANPLTHYPHEDTKDLDFFMVAGYEQDRVLVARDYLLPIFASYRGLWAGPRWRFGAGPLPSAEVPAYYARCRIALNPLHRSLVSAPRELSQRTFAALACGAFVLTDRTPATARFFADDELTVADGPAEFVELFRHYVDAPQQRDEIVARGMRRVFAEHTYLHTVAALVRFIDTLQA